MYKGPLVFATNNVHKLEEARHILSRDIQLLSLNDIHCDVELPETHETIEENAIEKASFVYRNYQVNCFSDDTGLEVEALNGAPGVYSARYAGIGKSNLDNINLLLSKMKGIGNRKANFRTIIGLILDGKQHMFEGIVKGRILETSIGGKGFGYDAVFQPEGFAESFAQMELNEKSKVSHRKIALKKLTVFLNSNQ